MPTNKCKMIEMTYFVVKLKKCNKFEITANLLLPERDHENHDGLKKF